MDRYPLGLLNPPHKRPGVLNPPRAGGRALPQLSDFYGIGPGQIPGDWRMDQAVQDTTVSVRNDGGAGAAFALSGNAPPNGMFVETGGATLRALDLANPVDMVGVHFLAVLDFTTTGGTILSREAGASGYYINVTDTSVRIIMPTENILLATVARPNGPGIYELRWDGATATTYLNGVRVGSVPLAAASWLVHYVGRGRGDRPAHAFNGKIGRCVSVVMDPAKSSTDPEQAVLVARQTLAAQYGVLLT